MGFINQRNTGFPLPLPFKPQCNYFSKTVTSFYPTLKDLQLLYPLNGHLLSILTTASAAPVTGRDTGDDVGGHGGFGQGCLIGKSSSSTGIFGIIHVFNDGNAVILRRLEVSVFIMSLLLIRFFLSNVYLEGFT